MKKKVESHPKKENEEFGNLNNKWKKYNNNWKQRNLTSSDGFKY